MTDSELLLGAAKAIGYRQIFGEDKLVVMIEHPAGYLWDPINSDRDAFGLMINLRIDLSFIEDWWVRGRGPGREWLGHTYTVGSDLGSIIRRVIVRCAGDLVG